MTEPRYAYITTAYDPTFTGSSRRMQKPRLPQWQTGNERSVIDD